jgi:hypothetical protein
VRCEFGTLQFGYGPGLERFAMNLMIWIPAMVALGLVALNLMFAFLAACERV